MVPARDEPALDGPDLPLSEEAMNVLEMVAGAARPLTAVALSKILGVNKPRIEYFLGQLNVRSLILARHDGTGGTKFLLNPSGRELLRSRGKL